MSLALLREFDIMISFKGNIQAFGLRRPWLPAFVHRAGHGLIHRCSLFSGREWLTFAYVKVYV